MQWPELVRSEMIKDEPEKNISKNRHEIMTHLLPSYDRSLTLVFNELYIVVKLYDDWVFPSHRKYGGGGGRVEREKRGTGKGGFSGLDLVNYQNTKTLFFKLAPRPQPSAMETVFVIVSLIKFYHC